MNFNVNTSKVITHISRGDIYYANLEDSKGSEQGGIRPVIIVGNNIGNRFSPIVLAAPVTDNNHHKAAIPTHVFLDAKKTGLKKDSIALLEQVRVLDKNTRLLSKIGNINEEKIPELNRALAISFDLKS